MPEVIMYTKPGCMPCVLTAKKLDALGIAYRPASAVENLDYLRELGAMESPVVVVEEEGMWWSGYRPDRLEELAEMLAVSDVC